MFKWEMSPSASPRDRLIDALPAPGRVMAFCMSAVLHDTERTCLSRCVCACLFVCVCQASVNYLPLC